MAHFVVECCVGYCVCFLVPTHQNVGSVIAIIYNPGLYIIASGK